MGRKPSSGSTDAVPTENRPYYLVLEEKFKKQCAKEIADWKAGKRKLATVKVNYIQGFDEYNARNDNDKPWFTEEQLKRK